jgi:D-alanyl-D-alanine carboxypeptidase (penicillin-binding protein 5/6)
LKKIRFWLIVHIIMALLITGIPEKTSALTNVSAKSAILIEQESGRVLFGKNENQQRRIASITKILTAIIAIESGKLDDIVTVSKRAEGTEGSSLYLEAGYKIKLGDLVYGLMLRSGNDGAVAIAEYVGGSLEGFVFLMNQKAQEIGMTNSVFANPHGLDDHENHYSTAYDMAKLTQYAMQNEIYREIVGTKVHRAENPNESWDWVWRNKNKLLTQLYENSTGGKTGYTKRAKRTLVSTAQKDGVNLIAVTLDAPDDWNDHISMFEWAFDNYELKKIVKEGKFDDVEHEFYKDKLYLKRDFYYPLMDKEEEDLTIEIKVIEPKPEWKDDDEAIPEKVGTMEIKLANETIGELPIYYEDEAVRKEDSWFSIFIKLFFPFLGDNQNG